MIRTPDLSPSAAVWGRSQRDPPLCTCYEPHKLLTMSELPEVILTQIPETSMPHSTRLDSIGLRFNNLTSIYVPSQRASRTRVPI